MASRGEWQGLKLENHCYQQVQQVSRIRYETLYIARTLLEYVWYRLVIIIIQYTSPYVETVYCIIFIFILYNIYNYI